MDLKYVIGNTYYAINSNSDGEGFAMHTVALHSYTVHANGVTFIVMDGESDDAWEVNKIYYTPQDAFEDFAKLKVPKININ